MIRVFLSRVYECVTDSLYWILSNFNYVYLYCCTLVWTKILRRFRKTAFLAVGISSILVFALYGFPILALTYLKLNGVVLTNPEEGIPYIIKNYFPTGLKAAAFAILFAAAATTLSGIWSALTTMLVGDYLLSSKNPTLGKDYIGSMKIYFMFAIISWILGNIFVDKILNKLILANIPIAALSFALLAGFYWQKASRNGAIISIILGFVWGSDVTSILVKKAVTLGIGLPTEFR